MTDHRFHPVGRGRPAVWHGPVAKAHHVLQTVTGETPQFHRALFPSRTMVYRTACRRSA